ITRTLAQRLSTQWGKQVLVDNKPGAGSTLGTALAAKAAKDGHTLLVASTPLGVAPAVYPSLSYDARRDFAPLSLVGMTPEALAVAAPQRSPQLPDVPTLAEAGYPELEFRIWMGLMAPAGTPEPVLKAIEAGIAEAMRDPALRAAITAQGWEIIGSGAREFAA